MFSDKAKAYYAIIFVYTIIGINPIVYAICSLLFFRDSLNLLSGIVT